MWGAIIGAGAALAGGLLSSSSKNKATAAQKDIALQELEYQKELHKNQIQWRVEDAKKAGLHPLASLGLSSYSYSPVSSSIDTSGTDYNWMGDIGQNIDRAIQQGKTKEERDKTKALDDKLIEIQIRKGTADAELAETQAADARFRLQQQMFPPTPPANSPDGLIPGQTGSIIVTPSEVKRAESRGTQAGAPPSVQWFSNPDGSVTRSMSEQAKTANEDDIINTIGWHIDNNVIPFSHRFGSAVPVNPTDFAPPLKYLPKGAVGWLPDGFNRFVPVYDWNVPGAFYGEDS